jgi:hypothetical protein
MRIRLLGIPTIYEQLIHIRTALEQRGNHVFLPKRDEREPKTTDDKRRHVERVSKEIEQVDAVLVVNVPVDGVANAISPTVLREIGVAFYHEKTIYVLHAFPADLAAELTQIGAVALNGDLNKL